MEAVKLISKGFLLGLISIGTLPFLVIKSIVELYG